MSFYANFYCYCHIRASLYSAFDFNITYLLCDEHQMNTRRNEIDNKMIAFKFEILFITAAIRIRMG